VALLAVLNAYEGWCYNHDDQNEAKYCMVFLLLNKEWKWRNK